MSGTSAENGFPTDWHLVHLGSRAVGGAGLVITEATAVAPEGRISPADVGIWSDDHARALAPIAAFMRRHGAVPGIQLAHAGRKASTAPPWDGGGRVDPPAGGWEPVGPSAVAFSEEFVVPRALSDVEVGQLVESFGLAARRARAAGFEVVEVHAAHGYLLHEFLSPLSNRRTDQYGGSFDNRARLALEVARRVRNEWPASLPVFVRISATDWVDGGWTPAESIELARRLKAAGVDLIDCSSGGLSPNQQIPLGPGYQTPFAATIRKEAGIATGAVGLITSPEQAEHILVSGQADAVIIARELLRDPYWPLRAAKTLGAAMAWPKQYLRARN